jgi:hypothetical protein
MISVLLLTRNRAALLADCLASLAHQQPPGDEWEVVVLDTGSTDATPELLSRIEESAGRLPFRFRFKLTKQTGAFAEMRNRVADLAEGDRLLFTDDDCILPADWVARGVALLNEHDAAGGLLLGRNQLPLDPHWHPDLAWLLGLAVPGMLDPRYAGKHYYPQTACMAIHRHVFAEHRFHAVAKDFGEGEGIYLNEREDSALWRSMRRTHGLRLAIDPRWFAFHATPPERASWKIAMKRAWRDGRAEGLQRFNRTAANQAGVTMGVDFWGAVGNWFAESSYRDPNSVDPDRADGKSLPELKNEAAKLEWMGRIVLKHRDLGYAPPWMWMLRESGHWWQVMQTAPRKWKPRLLRCAVHGLFAGGEAQGKRMVNALRRWNLKESDKTPPAMQKVRHQLTRLDPTQRPDVVHLFCSGFLGDTLLAAHLINNWSQQEDSPDLELHVAERYALFFQKTGKLQKVRPIAENWADATVYDLMQQRTEMMESGKRMLGIVLYWHNASAASLLEATDHGKLLPLVMFRYDVGINKQRGYDAAAFLLEKQMDRPELENLARLLQWGGFRGRPTPASFDFIQPENDLSDAIPEGAIVLHPCTGESQKSWSDERWGTLARRLTEEGAGPLVLLGGPREIPYLDDFKHRHQLDAINWPLDVDSSIEAIFALLRRARLLVTTCSGPKHIAMAVGCPTVALHGQSDERRWAAYWDKEQHRTLRAAPQGLTASERAGWLVNQEMLAIEVKDVMAAIQDALTS